MSISQLKEELLLLNEVIYFDQNEYLRERTSSPSKLREVIHSAESLLARGVSKEDKYFLYGAIGNLLRIIGDSKEAINYLSLNLKYSIARGDKTREIISLIRLGEALKYNSNHEIALDKFDKVITLCQESETQSYLDFALQHKGKCLLEVKRVEEAMICFQEAYTIRKQKGNADLLESTDLALRFAQSQL